MIGGENEYTATVFLTELRLVKDGDDCHWNQSCPNGHESAEGAIDCHKGLRAVLARSKMPETPREAIFLADILRAEKQGYSVELRLVKFTTSREIIPVTEAIVGERLN